jgi:hypothetical protein
LKLEVENVSGLLMGLVDGFWIEVGGFRKVRLVVDAVVVVFGVVVMLVLGVVLRVVEVGVVVRVVVVVSVVIAVFWKFQISG